MRRINPTGRWMGRLLPLVLVPMCMACGSTNYDRPGRDAPAPASRDLNREFGRMEIDGLVEYGKNFPFGREVKGAGKLTVERDRIKWDSEKNKRDFSIRTDVVNAVTLKCPRQAGDKLCLELTLETVTGLEYSFRDSNWAAGQNERILALYDFLQRNHSRMLFQEQTVKSL